MLDQTMNPIDATYAFLYAFSALLGKTGLTLIRTGIGFKRKMDLDVIQSPFSLN